MNVVALIRPNQMICMIDSGVRDFVDSIRSVKYMQLIVDRVNKLELRLPSPSKD